jgi:L-ascorbate metabolism protein UlaG (beta-lactamase superfamily)
MSALTYVGHATVLVEIDGQRIVTDPLSTGRVWHLRRKAPPPAPLGEVDAVLISHGHRDHLDVRSLAALGHGTTILVPRGVGRLLRGRGFERVEEVVAGEELRLGSLVVCVTPALHGGHGLRGGAAVGYTIRGSASVYFAGDTDLFDGLEAIGGGGLDVALLPVWGWGPRVGAGHLDPERAAEAVRLLRPRVAVPVHWGTYASPGGDASDAPARRFAAACAGDVVVRILAPGQCLRFGAAPRTGPDPAAPAQAAQRKPMLPVEESGVRALRAETR